MSFICQMEFASLIGRRWHPLDAQLGSFWPVLGQNLQLNVKRPTWNLPNAFTQIATFEICRSVLFIVFCSMNFIAADHYLSETSWFIWFSFSFLFVSFFRQMILWCPIFCFSLSVTNFFVYGFLRRSAVDDRIPFWVSISSLNPRRPRLVISLALKVDRFKSDFSCF